MVVRRVLVSGSKHPKHNDFAILRRLNPRKLLNMKYFPKLMGGFPDPAPAKQQFSHHHGQETAAILLALAVALILWPDLVDQTAPPAEGASHVVISSSQLPAPGSILDLAPSPAALVRTPAGRLLAVSLNCPYLGCRLTWDPVQKVFACPCHGDRFGPNGSWWGGAAPSHLHRHPVESVDGGSVRVDFSGVFLMIGRETAADVQYPTSHLELHM